MANVTINPGAVLLNIVSKKPFTIAMANRVVPPNGSGTIAANRVMGDFYRAQELANLVRGGYIDVQLNGVNLTPGQLLGFDVGIMNPPSFADATRPLPADVGSGYTIWNTDDGFTNVSDGTNWLDPNGAIT
jgi:hypothetical protein